MAKQTHEEAADKAVEKKIEQLTARILVLENERQMARDWLEKQKQTQKRSE